MVKNLKVCGRREEEKSGEKQRKAGLKARQHIFYHWKDLVQVNLTEKESHNMYIKPQLPKYHHPKSAFPSGNWGIR